jgi:hypothetical protein
VWGAGCRVQGVGCGVQGKPGAGREVVWTRYPRMISRRSIDRITVSVRHASCQIKSPTKIVRLSLQIDENRQTVPSNQPRMMSRRSMEYEHIYIYIYHRVFDARFLPNPIKSNHRVSVFVVCGLGFRVQGLGFRVQGSGFRVWVLEVLGEK